MLRSATRPATAIAALCLLAACLVSSLASPLCAQIPFVFAASDETITYDVAVGAGSTAVSFSIEELPGPAFPHNAAGFAMAVAHDPALVTVTAIQPGAHLASLGGGAGPAFFNPSILAGGFTVGTIFDFLGQLTAAYAAPQESIVASYASVASAWIGDLDGGSAALTFQPLGSPLTQNVVIVSGASNLATGTPGAIELVATGSGGPQMLRGDANGDGTVIAIADAISVLGQLFSGAPPSACLDAADVNGDGAIDIADPIALLAWGFSGGPPPPAPFPS
jgi:hypothetical protein